MTITYNSSNRIARRAAEQGARDTVNNQAVLDKSATGDKHHLLKCKKNVLVSSFNVNTLNSLTKMGEITSCAEQQGIDVICIQEHRVFHEEINIHHQKMGNGWMLLTSSAEKADNNATIRGVGFLLSLTIPSTQ